MLKGLPHHAGSTPEPKVPRTICGTKPLKFPAKRNLPPEVQRNRPICGSQNLRFAFRGGDRDARKLPAHEERAVTARITALSAEHRPPGAQPLSQPASSRSGSGSVSRAAMNATISSSVIGSGLTTSN